MEPTAKVTSNLPGNPVEYSIDRQLTGAGSPTFGLAIGGGSLTLRSPANHPYTPNILPGGDVTIDARADYSSPAHRRFTGKVSRVSGSATSPLLECELTDKVPRKKKFMFPVVVNGQFDPSGLIAFAGQTVGYYAAPAGVQGTCLILPLHGYPFPSVGTASGPANLTTRSYEQRSWSSGTIDTTLDHPLYPMAVNYMYTEVYVPEGATGDRLTMELTPGFPDALHIKQDGSVGMTRSSGYAQMLPPVSKPGIYRYQFLVTVDGPFPGTELRFFVEVRRFDGTSWTAWTPTMLSDFRENIHLGEYYDSFKFTFRDMAWLTIQTNETDTDFQPTAVIDATGFTMNGMVMDPQDDLWSFMQQVTDQVAGSLSMDEDGRLVFRSRNTLRGIGVESTKVLGIDKLGSIDWSIDENSVADRVEVSFTPLDITDGGHTTVWEAENVIKIPGRTVIALNINLQDVGIGNLRDFRMSTSATLENDWSRWIAFSTATGSSSPVDPSALSIDMVQTGTSSARVEIRNTTTSTLWIRTLDGDPALWIRAGYVARAGDSSSAVVGVTAEQSEQTFTHDAGTSIQTFEDAHALATYWLGRMTDPQIVYDTVDVLPDYSLKVGQKITVYDPAFTDTRTYALIVGISESMSAGAPSMQLTLAILPPSMIDRAKFFQKIDPDMSVTERALWLQSELGGVSLTAAAQWLKPNVVEV